MSKNQRNLDLFGFGDWEMVFVGLDGYMADLAKQLETAKRAVPNFPPVNVRKLDDSKYVIEMALAGYGKSDIELEMEGDKLHIKGKSSDDDPNCVFRGIAKRAFTRTFSIVDNLEVKNATMINGMLKVTLESMSKLNKKTIPID
jgi:molecular chaperone IbpA